jgi:hypothetical protein
MDDVMRGSMVSTPPPMVVTFAEDYPGAGVRIVERWWPGRVLIDGRLIDQALRGETRVLRVSRAVDDINAPLVAAFEGCNGRAVYTQMPTSMDLLERDIYEFECVSCSRDLTDG